MNYTKPISYPTNNLHKSNNYITMFNTTDLTNLNARFRTKGNSLYYTYNKGTFIYKPHSAYGMVGTSASSYLARRGRL